MHDRPRSFLEEDWGRRAAVRLGPPPAGFEDLLSLDDVDRFLTTTALRTPFFRLVKAGETIPEASYTRSGRAGSRDVTGIANPARVAALFEDGATIVLQGLHRWSEPVARFCRDLELELGHPCQVNAYITPPGAQGLDLHVDGHDVFVLQAFGRKHWEVHAAPKEPSREPLDVELAAGDTIYLPAGTPHAARAQDVLSGHLTVGVHVTPWRDVLASALADVTAGIEDPVPAGWIDDPDGFAEGSGRGSRRSPPRSATSTSDGRPASAASDSSRPARSWRAARSPSGRRGRRRRRHGRRASTRRGDRASPTRSSSSCSSGIVGWRCPRGSRMRCARSRRSTTTVRSPSATSRPRSPTRRAVASSCGD